MKIRRAAAVVGLIALGAVFLRGQEKAGPLRYEDLGPAVIDVSDYPDFQKINYRLFMERCSRCHTPARAINSPIVTEKEWKHYVNLMHIRSKKTWLKPDDLTWIAEFLAYDSKIRKVDHRDEFLRQQKALQDRFAKMK